MQKTVLNASQVGGLKDVKSGTPVKIWRGTLPEFQNGSASADTWYCYKANKHVLEECETYFSLLDWRTTYNLSTPVTRPLIAWGDGKLVYLAGGSSASRVYWTTSGRTWESWIDNEDSPYKDTDPYVCGIASLPASATYNLLHYADNVGFVAIGPNGAAVFSADGQTWVAGTTTSNVNPSWAWTGVAYGNNKFVAVKYQAVATSSDGKAWTVSSNSDVSSSARLTFGNGKFVRVETSGLYYSTDGTSWTKGQTISGSLISSGQHAIVYGNNKFVVPVGAKMYTSSDGISWTEGTNPAGATTVNDSMLFVDGYFIFIHGDKAYYSTDGTNWTYTSITFPTDTYYDYFAFTGTTLFAVGKNSKYISYVPIHDVFYTLDSTVTTDSIVYYDQVNTESLKEVTAVDGSQITIVHGSASHPESGTYTRYSTGDIACKLTVGTAHPDYLCFVGSGSSGGSISMNNVVVGKSYAPSVYKVGCTLFDNGGELLWDSILPDMRGSNSKYLKSNNGSLVFDDPLPTRSFSDTNKYLRIGSSSSTLEWAYALPDQSSSSGQYLTTNGTSASWAPVSGTLPSGSTAGQVIVSQGGEVFYWSDVSSTAQKTIKYSDFTAGMTNLTVNEKLGNCSDFHVYKNGMRLSKQFGSSDTDYDYTYTRVSDSQYTITFTTALQPTDIVLIDLFYNKIILEVQPSTTIELSGDFNTHTSYLTHLTGTTSPFVIDTTNDRLYSGSDSYNTNKGVSWGYVQFTTPNFATTFHVEGHASSEANYDFGAVILSLTNTAVLNGITPVTGNDYASSIKNATVATTVSSLTSSNPIVIMRSTGDNSSNSTVEITLSPSTTYYAHFVYAKDGSGNKFDDRFYISKIRFTVPQS